MAGWDSDQSISTPTRTMAAPKKSFTREVSAFFKKRMPGTLPASTRAARGRQTDQRMDFRSRQATIRLVG